MNSVFWKEEHERDAAADDRDRDEPDAMGLVEGLRLASSPERECQPDQDDRGYTVLGCRVNRRVRHELDPEGVQVDGESADRGRPKGQQYSTLGVQNGMLSGHRYPTSGD
jgi:hypothetical protein